VLKKENLHEIDGIGFCLRAGVLSNTQAVGCHKALVDEAESCLMAPRKSKRPNGEEYSIWTALRDGGNPDSLQVLLFSELNSREPRLAYALKPRFST
jgi:hypothetical protein